MRCGSCWRASCVHPARFPHPPPLDGVRMPVAFHIDIRPVASWSDADWRDWHELNQSLNEGHPLLHARFLRAALRHFGHPEVLGIRASDSCGTQLLALAQRHSRGLFELFTPPQAPYGPLLLKATDTQAAHALLRATLRSLPPPAYRWHLYHQNSAWPSAKHVPDWMDRRATMQVEAAGNFDDYWRRPRPVDAVERHIRRLKKRNLSPQLKVICRSDQIEEAIDAHALLETSGWKGRQASAIVKGTAAGDFYRELLGAYAADGCAYAYQLTLADRVVASQLALVGGRHLALLKTAYDEQYRQYGPGRLLDFFMLQHVFANLPGSLVDFCNIATPEDLRWATARSTLMTGAVYHNDALRVMAGVARSVLRPWRGR